MYEGLRKLCSLMAATILMGAASAVSAQVMEQFNLPAQPLADALRAVGTQTNINVLFDPPLVASYRAPALSARLSVDEALTRLLASTPFRHKFVDERTVVLSAGKDSGIAAPVSSTGAAKTNGALWLAREGSQSSQSGGGRTDQAPSPSSQQQNSASNGQSDSGARLDEILVTATKRTERLQDVPISIAVVTAEDIDRRGLVSAEDYLRNIPGANQVEGRAGQTIVIRGLETTTQSQNFSSGTTVATYFGETPTTNTAGIGGGSNVDLKLVDIERVEVLRGPQGTAFGNSSMGGAVRTIPVAPKPDRFEGRVAAGYSVTSGTGGDNYNVQAVGNIPLIKDKLALRATAYRYEDSGFYRNRAGSDAAFQSAVAIYGAQAFATDAEEVGEATYAGGRVAALFRPTDDLRLTVSYLSQKTERDGFAGANSAPYEQLTLQVAPEQVVRGQTGGVFDTDIDIANATVEYDLGWADLLASYSNIDSGSMLVYPFSISGSAGLLSVGGAPSPVSLRAPSDHGENVGEIRIATHLTGAWNFLGGLYAEDIDDAALYDYYRFAAAGRFLGTYNDRRSLRQRAAFGEASWEFVHGWTLTGGVRAYEYKRSYRLDAAGTLYGANGIHEGGDAKASGTTFRANLSYKIDPDALVYAGWSQGFRVGRPTSGLPAGVCDINGDGILDGTSNSLASTRRVDSDNVDSYEIGGKFALLDRRVAITGAVFRMDWSDMPVTIFAPGTIGSTDGSGCGLNYVANAGAARSEGAELQANMQLTQAFRVDVGGSWIRAHLTQDVPAQGLRAGARLPGAPEVNANLGLQYDFAIAGQKLSVRTDATYIGAFYGTLPQSAGSKAGDYVKLDASARLVVHNVNIDLLVRNITNDDAFVLRGTAAGVGGFYGHPLRPRTIGLQLSYDF